MRGRKRHRKKAAKKAAALEAKRLAKMTRSERFRTIVAKFSFDPSKGMRRLKRAEAVTKIVAQSLRFSMAMWKLAAAAAMATPRMARLRAQLKNLPEVQ